MGGHTGQTVAEAFPVVAVITALSCLLSFVGSLAIMGSFLLFDAMKRKQGRELLFYLSLCDLATALLYTASLFRPADAPDDGFCKVQALLSIFFPVASFLWTDCVSYFLYRMVAGARRPRSFLPYHLVCWVVPATMIIVLAVFNREGSWRGPESDEDMIWCWVSLSPNEAHDAGSWMWMLVAGKGVEFPSVFIIAPGFFWLVHRRVSMQLQRLRDVSGRHGFGSARMGRRGVRGDSDSSGLTATTATTATATNPSSSSSGAGSTSVPVTTPTTPQERAAARRTGQLDKTHSALSEFASKLKLVPLLFLLTRFWGNLHLILLMSLPEGDGALQRGGVLLHTLQLLQAFFDPFQGAANAVVFVLMSRDVRGLYVHWWHQNLAPRLRCCCCCCCCGCSWWGRRRGWRGSFDGDGSEEASLLLEASGDFTKAAVG